MINNVGLIGVGRFGKVLANILKKGFHGTRIKEVLECSKTSKGSLYYYFPEGKKQLCKECLKLSTIKLSTLIVVFISC